MAALCEQPQLFDEGAPAPRQQFRHIEALLTLYYRDLAALLKHAEHSRDITRKRLDRLEEEGPYSSYGVARLGGDAHSTAEPMTPTERQALIQPDRREYHQRRQDLLAQLDEERQALDDLEDVQLAVEGALLLVPQDLQAALEKMARDATSASNLPVALSPSTIRYHVHYAKQRMDALLRHRLYSKELPWLRRNHREVFPGTSAVRGRKRTTSMVMC